MQGRKLPMDSGSSARLRMYVLDFEFAEILSSCGYSAQNKGPGQEGAPLILTSLTRGFWTKMSTPYKFQLWNGYPPPASLNLGWNLPTA